jgi:hypothetical protein
VYSFYFGPLFIRDSFLSLYIEHTKTFGTNYIYNLLNYIFQHQTGLKQKKKISYKVIDLIEYYNIKIKFVFSDDII